MRVRLRSQNREFSTPRGEKTVTNQQKHRDDGNSSAVVSGSVPTRRVRSCPRQPRTPVLRRRPPDTRSTSYPVGGTRLASADASSSPTRARRGIGGDDEDGGGGGIGGDGDDANTVRARNDEACEAAPLGQPMPSGRGRGGGGVTTTDNDVTMTTMATTTTTTTNNTTIKQCTTGEGGG